MPRLMTDAKASTASWIQTRPPTSGSGQNPPCLPAATTAKQTASNKPSPETRPATSGAYAAHKTLIEKTVIKYLKENDMYNTLLNEQGEVKSIEEQEPYMTCFGIDVYEKGDELISEDRYEKL